MREVDQDVQKIIPSFAAAYNVWEDRKTLRKISLVEINDIFKIFPEKLTSLLG